MNRSLLVIHGGCGRFEAKDISFDQYDKKLREIVAEGYAFLVGHSAMETTRHVMRLLENEEIFNSGTGSKLQRDGLARMSAAFVDGSQKRFSAVINVENIQHPIELAYRLQVEKHTVLAGPPATKYAREQDFAKHNPITAYRKKEHEEKLTGETGTCGAVVVDCEGRICVGTSTDGIGYEVPGRVGDSPTVSGTFANRFCGVSCTGIGEHINHEAVAAAVVTRCSDGVALADAVARSIKNGNRRKFHFGLIAATVNGEIIAGQTESATVLFAQRDRHGLRTFADSLAK
ncbi:MAG: asparaginase [Verrucomicrobiaceae bacterium]|nr:asparaginase [Verrucomicrobiaceae bacterium]